MRFLGTPASLEDKSNPDWIPNQNMGYISSAHPGHSAAERYNRTVSRKRKKIEGEVCTLVQIKISLSEASFIKKIFILDSDGSIC